MNRIISEFVEQLNTKLSARDPVSGCLIVRTLCVCYWHYLCLPELMDAKFWWVSKSLK